MYSITKIGNNPNNATGLREFIADYISDIDKLPHINNEGVQQNENTVSNDKVSAGSKCLCIEDSKWYVLGNDDVWHIISNSNISSASSLELDENGILSIQ